MSPLNWFRRERHFSPSSASKMRKSFSRMAERIIRFISESSTMRICGFFRADVSMEETVFTGVCSEFCTATLFFWSFARYISRSAWPTAVSIVSLAVWMTPPMLTDSRRWE